MLGYVAFLFLTVLSVRLALSLRSYREVIARVGFSTFQFRMLQTSLLLYVLSLLGFAVPVGVLKILAPIPLGFLLLIPGILLGKKISARLETAGNDVAERASRVVVNAFWLGIGSGVFMAGNIAVELIVGSYHG